jgi:putative redox protein
VKASVVLKHDMTFQGLADSGRPVQMSNSNQDGGDDGGPTPMEFILMGLGGCTAMDVISILRKKRQQVTNFEVKLEAARAANHPHVFTDITINYIVYGREVNPKAVLRAIELSRDKYCPALAMLSPTTNITHEYEIVEIEDPISTG